MSLRVNRNLGPFTSGAQSIFAFLQWLVYSHGGTKFSTIVASGDGLSTYSGTGNALTHSGSGAGGLDNNNAWFVMCDPDSNRWLLFYRGVQHYQWYLWYQLAAFDLTGCDASTPPSAANNPNRKSWMTVRSAGPISLFPSSGSWYTHICCEGDTPEGNVYPFWMLARVVGTGASAGAFWMDCAIDALSPVADSDKALLMSAQNDHALNSNTGAYLGSSNVANSCLSGFMRYGEANEDWNVLTIPTYYDFTYLIPGAVGTNPEDGKYPILPSFVWRTGTGTQGLKGQCYMHRWAPSSALTFGDVVYDGTDYFLVVDQSMLRGWPDSTGPSI